MTGVVIKKKLEGQTGNAHRLVESIILFLDQKIESFMILRKLFFCLNEKKKKKSKYTFRLCDMAVSNVGE